MFKSLLVVLCLSFPMISLADEGQYQVSEDTPVVDVIGEITQNPTETAVVKDELPAIDVEKLSKDMKENIEAMREFNEQLKVIADELAKINLLKMANPDTEVIGDNTDLELTSRVQKLETSVGKLEAGELTPALDTKIRKLAVEEYQKIQLTVKSSNGEKVVKEVVLSGKEVQVNGYSGGFMLNPGESLVAIDGVPVRTQAYNDTNVVGATNNTIVNARGLPNNGFLLNIVRPPVQRFQQTLSTCRMVNGVKVCN